MIQSEKVKIAFYKWYKSRNIIDWIIGIFTMSKYSHCEIVYGDESYSSSIFDGGVRSKKINYLKNIERWDIYDITLNGLKSNLFLDFYYRTEGSKYDLIGILLFFIFGIFTHKRKNRFYCSNWCFLGIKYLLGNVNPQLENISPKRLFKFLKKIDIIKKTKLGIF